MANEQMTENMIAWDVVRIDGYAEIEDLTALTGDHPKYLGWVPLERVLAQKPE